MKIINFEDHKFGFTPEQNHWYDQLDKYKKARMVEIADELQNGETSLFDVINQLAFFEVRTIDYGKQAESILGSRNYDENEDLKSSLLSESFGGIDMKSPAYKKYIEKERD